MADFDPLTVPAVMPAAVRRSTERDVNGKVVQGFPTQALLDYEQALQAWMKANVTAVNIRFNEVTDSVGDVSAAVTAEAAARVNADTALATDITAVEAVANGISANGQVALYAVSGPAGAAAAFEVGLTAGASLAGLQIIAWSGGGSAIGFTANQFYFVDSGTGQQVFTYSGGKFGFTSDVEIDGNLAINGSFSSLAVASGFSARGSTAGTQALSGGSTSWTDLGAPLALTVEPDATTGDSYPLIYIRDSSFANAGGLVGAASVDIRLLINGVAVYTRSIYSTTLSASGQIADGITDFFDTASAGGSQTFQLQYQHNFGVGVTGSVFAKVMALMISR